MRSCRWAIGAVAIVILTAIAWLWVKADADPQPPQGVVVVKQDRPVAAQPAAGPVPIAGPTPPVADTSAPFVATPEILKALALPAEAVFRETALVDKSDAVTCGEVSRSPRDDSFRRFVYIGSAKSGFVDDGGPVFKQISAASCKPRD